MTVAPLKFNDPEMERETYVNAFISTLIDLSDGNMTLDKAIDMLNRYGYEKSSIALYVDEAFNKFEEIQAKWETTAKHIWSKPALSISQPTPKKMNIL